MKKTLFFVAILCSMAIASRATEESYSETGAAMSKNATAMDTTSCVSTTGTIQSTSSSNQDPSYDKTKEKGKVAGKAIVNAVHATKRKIVNGEENTGAGDATMDALKATGETIVEATVTTGSYIKKEAPVVADSIKSKGKRVIQKIQEW